MDSASSTPSVAGQPLALKMSRSAAWNWLSWPAVVGGGPISGRSTGFYANREITRTMVVVWVYAEAKKVDECEIIVENGQGSMVLAGQLNCRLLPDLVHLPALLFRALYNWRGKK